MPERTARRDWYDSTASTTLDTVIDHADSALERWLTATLDVASVDFVASVDPSSTDQPIVAVVLSAVAERVERRDNDVADVRDADGRVTARRRSLRFFDLDYRVSVTGDQRAAHAVLGRLLQALVDTDTIDSELLPAPLRELEVPIEVTLQAGRAGGGSSTDGLGLLVRLVVPVAPTPDEDISAPAVELHLDMSPPPVVGALPSGDDTTRRFLGERTWTTVRRREAIAPVRPEAPGDDDAARPPATSSRARKSS